MVLFHLPSILIKLRRNWLFSYLATQKLSSHSFIYSVSQVHARSLFARTHNIFHLISVSEKSELILLDVRCFKNETHGEGDLLSETLWEWFRPELLNSDALISSLHFSLFVSPFFILFSTFNSYKITFSIVFFLILVTSLSTEILVQLIFAGFHIPFASQSKYPMLSMGVLFCNTTSLFPNFKNVPNNTLDTFFTTKKILALVEFDSSSRLCSINTAKFGYAAEWPHRYYHCDWNVS